MTGVAEIPQQNSGPAGELQVRAADVSALCTQLIQHIDNWYHLIGVQTPENANVLNEMFYSSIRAHLLNVSQGIQQAMRSNGK